VFSRAKKDRPVRITPLGFRPPQVSLDGDLEWVLQRAFGPLDWSPTRHVSGPRLVDVALRLDLASRIAARQPRGPVEQEIGATAARRLREQYVAVVARGALLEHALSELLNHARTADVPCVLLKYAALTRMGVLRVGSRVATDIDVLVPHVMARRFHTFLIEKGYQDLGLPGSSHQLAGLRGPGGVVIELHVHVPLITLAAEQPFARAHDLHAAGLILAADNALLPDPAVVAAHAIAHGLIQHASAPHVYSPLKTFADLADLQVARPDIVQQARPYLSRTMTEEDLESVHTLSCALLEGNLQTAQTGGAGSILRHALASQLDRRYAFRLRLSGFLRSGKSVRRSPGELFKSLRAAWERVRTEPHRPS